MKLSLSAAVAAAMLLFIQNGSSYRMPLYAVQQAGPFSPLTRGSTSLSQTNSWDEEEESPRSFTGSSSRHLHGSDEDTTPIDFTKLKSDDPLFLDMPWPKESGPESAAFARHMQWKRRLSDGERIRWHRWAVYKRLRVKNLFQYSPEDFVLQSMLKTLHSSGDGSGGESVSGSGSIESGSGGVDASIENGSMSGSGSRSSRGSRGIQLTGSPAVDGVLFRTMAKGLVSIEEDEVRGVMAAYYSAFNRGNFDEIRAFWLPDDNSELLFPGYEKARGGLAIDKLYRHMVREAKPFGSVDATIKSIQCYGYLAVVHAVEVVGEGSAISKAAKGRRLGVQKSGTAKRILTTTVLRNANKQWRVAVHHAVRVLQSPYTECMDVSFSRRDARNRIPEAVSSSTNSGSGGSGGGGGVGVSSDVSVKVLDRVKEMLGGEIAAGKAVVVDESELTSGRQNSRTKPGSFMIDYSESYSTLGESKDRGGGRRPSGKSSGDLRRSHAPPGYRQRRRPVEADSAGAALPAPFRPH